MKWITSINISNWAPQHNCKGQLPLMVRNLVHATAKGLLSIEMPFGDDIYTGGWDGIVVTQDDDTYVPSGVTLWEFGAEKDTKGKADRDYEKRSENPLGQNPANSTFIFVTPYKWNAKTRWVQNRKDEGLWKDVRVYDATDLEAWLDQAPAVASWLAKHLRVFPDNVQAIEDFWRGWSGGVDCILSQELVLAGREHAIKSLDKNLAEGEGKIVIKAPSRDEALAFVISHFLIKEVGARLEFTSKTLIVRDAETFRQLVVTPNPLNIIPLFQDDSSMNLAYQHGHKLIIPVGADQTNNSGVSVNLTRPKYEPFVSALEGMGFESDKARELSRESGRSLPILRRQLKFENNQPLWATSVNASGIIPLLLLGRWDGQKEGDRKIVEKLANQIYADVTRDLINWINHDDAPVYKFGESWRLASPMDAWTHLGSFVTDDELKSFFELAMEVLTEIPPEFELDQKDRYAAALHGKIPIYSEWLKEGILQSMVMLGVFGEELGSIRKGHQQSVDGFIYHLLEDCNETKWCALSPQLPLIAEASPDQFLKAVEVSLKKQSSPIEGMFKEVEGFITSTSYHTGLLWALENLAWMPQYLSRVTKILANLNEIDPGGSLANRPLSSLHEIFRGWLPHTSASLDLRLEAIGLMIATYPDSAWQLLKRLLPSGGGETSMPNHKMRWRSFDLEYTKGVLYADIHRQFSWVIDAMIEMAQKDEDKLSDIVMEIDHMTIVDRNKVLDYIIQNVPNADQVSYAVWHTLRKMLYHHRSFPDAKWSIPEPHLEKIQEAYDFLTPNKLTDRILWMFDTHWPEIPEGLDRKKMDYSEQEEYMQKLKVERLVELKNEIGIDNVIESIRNMKEPQSFGRAAGEVFLDEEDEIKLLPLLDSDSEEEYMAIMSFVRTRSRMTGLSWVDKYTKFMCENDVSDTGVIRFLLSLEQNKDAWQRVEKMKPEVVSGYWMQMRPIFYHVSNEDKIYGVTQLSAHNRHISALDVASHFLGDLESSLIMDLLEAVATKKSNENVQLQSWEANRLFEELDKRSDYNVQLLARLEWLYMPILGSYGNTRKPKLLHETLANDSSFFSEVIRLLYRPNSDELAESEVKDLTEAEMQLKLQHATLANELLRTWERMPGSGDDNNIDSEFLKSWIDRSRKQAQIDDRLGPCDHWIGEIFAKYPETVDGWPPQVMCEITDVLNSQALNDGFSSGLKNKRGFSSRAAFDGGDREREIAQYFINISESIAGSYPVTAGILKEVADEFGNSADRIDVDAERRESEL